MTETARRLAESARPHARARVLAVVLAGAGVVFAAGAVGIRLAPRPVAVFGAWLALLGAVAAAAWAALRAGRWAGPARLGELIEAASGARRGSVTGLLTGASPGTSAALLEAADRRAGATLSQILPSVRPHLVRDSARRLAAGAAVAFFGVALFLAAAPASGRAAAFWRPLATWRAAHAAIGLSADRSVVPRGDSVSVRVTAAGATHATLWARSPGESWHALPLTLDDSGHGGARLGPVEADLLLRATAGTRASDTLRVRVALPVFAGVFDLLARFPAYLERPDEPIVPGTDSVVLPLGTRLLVQGEASAPLVTARWSGPGASGALAVRGARFEGSFVPSRSGTWTVALAAAARDVPVEPLPALTLVLVPDSAPAVAVVVPGRDTTAPLSLRQPLVADVRDDHGISRIEIVSWRVSQTGRVDPPVREGVPLAGTDDRVIVQGELDLERRSLLPGDTLRYYVEAWDNAPTPARGRSREYLLRLPSRAELRAAARAAAASVAASAESLAAAQGDLADRTRDLAATRPATERAPGALNRSGTLGFQATERAAQVAREQAELEARAAALAEEMGDLARAVEAAGLQDSAFLARLEEVRDLLEQALTPELAERLQALQDALRRLDPEATRQALQRLADAQQQLRNDLERNRELFERAALEGALSTLAADAADLARRQEQWTETDAPRADSAAAAGERALGQRADSLRRALAGAEQSLARVVPGDSSAPIRAPRAMADQARETMRDAEVAAQRGDAPSAVREGAAAAEGLDALASELRRSRDSLALAWREEALAALDRALAETAALADRQAEVAEAMRRGETGASVRARQGAVEDGTAAVERQVREAAGRNALVSPQLESALGFAQRQMREAREQLNQAQPNPAAATALADEAVDALNATAHALARARGEVSGAQSGTGFAEAMEQLARLAQQQQGLAGEGQSLLPMMGQGGQAALLQLRALAARQRALAQQLEQLQATGGSDAAGALAAEARELARQLDAGRLDRRTVERQERLYRRLLDAGRTLTGEEPDPDKERESRTARGAVVRSPPALTPGATGAGPRLRYPTWDELRALTPEERRLVLEYYRRLNADTR